MSYFDDNEARFTGLPREVECKHELPRSMCSWCNGKPPDREVEQMLGTTSRPGSDEVVPDHETWVALYPGACIYCDVPFDVGATIGWSRQSRTTVGPCCWSPTEGNRGGWSR